MKNQSEPRRVSRFWYTSDNCRGTFLQTLLLGTHCRHVNHMFWNIRLTKRYMLRMLGVLEDGNLLHIKIEIHSGKLKLFSLYVSR